VALSGCGSFGLLPEASPDLPDFGGATALVVDAATDPSGSEEDRPTPTDDTGVSEPEPVVDDPPPYDPSAPGPFAVGVTTVDLFDSSRWRTIPVDIWYPMDPANPDGSDNVYELELFGLTLYEMATPARRDGTPLDGDWPAVMFSHGYGGIRFQSYFLTEHLASHGFVVIAPDHPGNTLMDFYNLGSDEAAYQSSVDRPLDITFALDSVLDGSAGFRGSIDPDRVGITGHSFGGWTSIQAPLDDPRLIATFPMAPGFKETAYPEMTADLGIPFFEFGGSEDATCEFEENQLPAYEAAGPPRYLVEILGAGHLDFSNLCEIELATLFIDDGCDATKIDPLDVQARAKTLGTAFAKVWIEGDDRYDDVLQSEAVLALGEVEYWSEE
jgi:predicted dienelactone hydrolase